MSLSRRDLLKLTALAATTRGASAEPEAARAAKPDVEVELRAAAGRVVVDAKLGHAIQVMRFDGKLLRGRADALTAQAVGYLGPTFRVRRGERVRVHFRNALNEPTIVHWHGLHVDEANDGHPRFAIGPGRTYEYDFVVEDRPGTYWYHPHPHDRTGAQVYWKAEADSVREGLVDEGLRDTVLVMPGERVKIRMRFDRHAGLFLYHCHNLEHEDMGMMRNFLVES